MNLFISAKMNHCKSNCILLILDVLNKIKAGLQYASNYLQTARDIANLVSKSLGHKPNQKRGEDGNDEKQPFGPSNFVSAFFRLIGFDSQKIAAIAVNSVIFLAQMVSIYGQIYIINYLNYTYSSDISFIYHRT